MHGASPERSAAATYRLMLASGASHAVALGALAWLLHGSPPPPDRYPSFPSLALDLTLLPPAPPRAIAWETLRRVAPAAPAAATLAPEPVAPSAAFVAPQPEPLAAAHRVRAIAPSGPEQSPELPLPLPLVPPAPERPAPPVAVAPGAPAPWANTMTPQSAPPGARSGALGGMDLYTHTNQDAMQTAAGGRSGVTDVTPGPGDPRAEALQASQGYLRGVIQDESTRQIPNSWSYYHGMRDQLRDRFHPGTVPVPSVADSIISSTAAGQDATRRSLGPMADGNYYAAGEALDHAHPNSPTLRPGNTMGGAAGATAITTRVILEVDQADGGAITAVRVVHGSGVTAFDAEAERAAREVVPTLPARAMPNGWTSRWAFEVTVERDPPLLFAGGMPGEGPAVTTGVAADFDEATREVVVRTPFALHRRTRIRLVSSRPTTSAAGPIAATAHPAGTP